MCIGTAMEWNIVTAFLAAGSGLAMSERRGEEMIRVPYSRYVEGRDILVQGSVISCAAHLLILYAPNPTNIVLPSRPAKPKPQRFS